MLLTGFFSPNLEQPGVLTGNPYLIDLVDEEGIPVDTENWKGKVVFLNIWATWCPPCRAEMPGIEDAYGELKQENLEFVILSVDEDLASAKAFKKKMGFSFPIYHLRGGLGPLYRDRSIPRSYVIDPQGNLVMKHTGMADYDSKKFKNLLRKLLSQVP